MAFGLPVWSTYLLYCCISFLSSDVQITSLDSNIAVLFLCKKLMYFFFFVYVLNPRWCHQPTRETNFASSLLYCYWRLCYVLPFRKDPPWSEYFLYPQVLGTVSGGTKEIVEHNVTGLLHPVGRTGTNVLAENIKFLLKNPAARKQMGIKGREKVEKMYLKRHMYKMFFEVLFKCMRIKWVLSSGELGREFSFFNSSWIFEAVACSCIWLRNDLTS